MREYGEIGMSEVIEKDKDSLPVICVCKVKVV